MRADFYAHSVEGEIAPSERWQKLRAHLAGVAGLAQTLATRITPRNAPGVEGNLGMGAFVSAARWAGFLHDVGKYRPEFQQMLRRKRPKGEATRHKQAGSAWAADGRRRDIAFAIAGHHGGLPDSEDLISLVNGPGGRDVAANVRADAVAESPELETELPEWARQLTAPQFDIWVRLLFSCLVDADWSDTGAHDRRSRGRPPLSEPALLDDALLERLIVRVSAYIDERAFQCREVRHDAEHAGGSATSATAPSSDVPSIRADILAAALAAAGTAPGLFSMTVPTGGGKTLASLAFALSHARQHGLRRVIYVAPYLSILEQNAREIRRALGAQLEPDDAALVFEHHSLAEPPDSDDPDEAESTERSRQGQNWSAPFIVTTNVQFFESLFSNRPGQCRKLHNVGCSVVILDECQTLPPGFVAPTCSMLRDLVAMTGATVVLCTATQPAWSRRPGFEWGLEGVREIAPKQLNLFERLRRVVVRWPRAGEPRLGWPDVAAQMCNEVAALCIVNTKSAAANLFSAVRDRVGGSARHLSTAMCPAHRLEVLDDVRGRLRDGERCHLVSTQLIEAGVDVDFPLVLRELAPLEAIVQSAGRCNREGLRNTPDGRPGGSVVVFRSIEGKLPRGDRWYEAGRDTLEAAFLKAGREPDIGQPEDMLEYFRRLYATGELDSRRIEALRSRQQFATVWHGDDTDRSCGRYRLIEDETCPLVVATWERHRATVENLLTRVARDPAPLLFRRLSRFQVNVRVYQLSQLATWVTNEANGLRVWRGRYDTHLGIVPENDDLDLVV